MLTISSKENVEKQFSLQYYLFVIMMLYIYYYNCTVLQPAAMVSELDHNKYNNNPGQTIDADTQCKILLFDNDASMDNNGDNIQDICSRLDSIFRIYALGWIQYTGYMFKVRFNIQDICSRLDSIFRIYVQG